MRPERARNVQSIVVPAQSEFAALSKTSVIRVSPAYRPLPCVSYAYRFRHFRLCLIFNALVPENPGGVCSANPPNRRGCSSFLERFSMRCFPL